MARKIVSLPYFRFFPADFLMSDLVSIMGPEERGAYITLLARAWNDSTCSIPSDETMLAKLTGLESRWESHRELILKGFPPHPTLQGRLANPRLLEERAFSEAQFSKVSEQRKVAAAGRHKPQANRDEPTTACDIIEEKIVKEKSTPKAPKGAGEPEGFASFWTAYPAHERKTDRRGTAKAFAKAVERGMTPEEILTGLEAWKASEKWAKNGGEYIDGPAKFLNQDFAATPPPAAPNSTPRREAPLPSDFKILDLLNDPRPNRATG